MAEPTRPVAETMLPSADARQRRQARRSAWLLGLVALAVYAAYLLFAFTHGHS